MLIYTLSMYLYFLVNPHFLHWEISIKNKYIINSIQINHLPYFQLDIFFILYSYINLKFL